MTISTAPLQAAALQEQLLAQHTSGKLPHCSSHYYSSGCSPALTPNSCKELQATRAQLDLQPFPADTTAKMQASIAAAAAAF
jgi:hypothetical protein